MQFNKKIAECVGLWFAEGDNKSKFEITFTNNCWELVELFHTTLIKLFNEYKPNIRIYVYNSTKKKIKIPLKNVQINYYVDKRATKPYYIWRLASKNLVKEWTRLVETTKNAEKSYTGILRGFFAGEGNIKVGSHGSRVIRVSQLKPYKLLESILNYFKISYKYLPMERSYSIAGKLNWDKCSKIRIADLHPIKKQKFWNSYLGFKEEHYSNNYLYHSLIDYLVKPHTSKEMSLKFKRSQARIYDVLSLLKREGKIDNFRVGSRDFWIRRDQNSIIVSKLKYSYLRLLKINGKSTQFFAKHFRVDWKSSFRRLKELERLGLVERDCGKKWKLLNTTKRLLNYGFNMRG